ncbi:4Fe-4S binding protein, partial [bacterium]|nr:4Fe-4S binding protein [bacterium]MBU1024382.1 4Fe-4S binding protein [bacterium]
MPGTIVTDEDRCKGCSLCVEFCPVNVLRLADRINAMGY